MTIAGSHFPAHWTRRTSTNNAAVNGQSSWRRACAASGVFRHRSITIARPLGRCPCAWSYDCPIARQGGGVARVTQAYSPAVWQGDLKRGPGVHLIHVPPRRHRPGVRAIHEYPPATSHAGQRASAVKPGGAASLSPPALASGCTTGTSDYRPTEHTEVPKGDGAVPIAAPLPPRQSPS